MDTMVKYPSIVGAFSRFSRRLVWGMHHRYYRLLRLVDHDRGQATSAHPDNNYKFAFYSNYIDILLDYSLNYIDIIVMNDQKIYIPRTIERQFTNLLKGDVSRTGALLVEGARQVGKSTLAYEACRRSNRRICSVDLEDNTVFRDQIDGCVQFGDFEELLTDELGFRTDSGALLLVDEAQESRRLGRFVRYMKERWRGVQVVLTGSSLTRLFRGDIRYPVGRVTRVHIAPFDFGEYLTAVGKQHLADRLSGAPSEISPARHRRYLAHFDTYLTVGGMPDVVLTHAAGGDSERRLRELLSDLRDDFLRLFGENDIDVVMSCFRSVANFVGSPSKISTVLRDAGRSKRRIAEQVFERLEQWAIVLRSDQRGPSPESAHAYHPKRYLFDTGLLRILRESAVPRIAVLDTVDPGQRRPLGGVLENQIAIAIHHHERELHGWKRSSSGSEIDFVVGPAARRMPIECKAALDIKLTHLKGLRRYLEHYGLERGFVVSFAPYQEFEVDDRTIVNVPAYLFRGDVAGSFAGSSGRM